MLLVGLVRRYLAPYRGRVALLLLLELLSVVAILTLPVVNADLVDRGLARADLDHVWRAGGLMLLVSLGQAVAAAVSSYTGAWVAMSFGRDVRRDVFEHVGRLSSLEVHGLGVPSLITRCTNDVQQVQMLVLMTCTMILTAPLMMVGGVVMALRVDPGLSWLLLAAVPLLALVVGVVVVRMVPSSRQAQERLDQVNRVLREQLMGVRVVRAFGREPTERERFGRVNDELTRVSRRVGRMMAALTPIVLVTMNLTVAGVLWYGGHRVEAGEMQVGALAAYLTYVVQILAATMMVSVMLVMLPRAAVSAERVAEVLRTEPGVRPPRRPAPLTRLHGVVDLVDVEVRHPGADAPVLSGVSLHAEPGQTVAVVGSTGAGKTTLVSLVARLLDVTAGQVRLDGTDVRDLDPAVLAAGVGLVPQRAYLFSGTVATNLRLGRPDASEAELWQALEVAQARDVVEAMDGGLEAAVLPGGTNLSGGQRQRLCLARALVARPRVYLLDDAFSALDASTEARARAALRAATRDATVLVVAQRAATVEDADDIVVLDQGRPVGRGRHDELLLTCATYREIVASQQLAEASR